MNHITCFTHSNMQESLNARELKWAIALCPRPYAMRLARFQISFENNQVRESVSRFLVKTSVLTQSGNLHCFPWDHRSVFRSRQSSHEKWKKSFRENFIECRNRFSNGHSFHWVILKRHSSSKRKKCLGARDVRRSRSARDLIPFQRILNRNTLKRDKFNSKRELP
jgi:hypothetical protein